MSEWQLGVQRWLLFHKDGWFVSSTRDAFVFYVGMDKSKESYLVAAFGVSGTLGGGGYGKKHSINPVTFKILNLMWF